MSSCLWVYGGASGLRLSMRNAGKFCAELNNVPSTCLFHYVIFAVDIHRTSQVPVKVQTGTSETFKGLE